MRSRIAVGAFASALAVGGLLLATAPSQAAAGTTTYSYTGPAVPIPDNGPAVSAPVHVSGQDGLVVTNVQVRIDGGAGCATPGIKHTWDGDLEISLRSPQGTTVMLANRRGGSGDNFCKTLFDDTSGTPISSGSAPFTGTFRPDGLLSAFNGENAGGTWRLVVRDDSPLDIGQINAFSLRITTAEVPASVSASGPVAQGGCFTLSAAGLQPGTDYAVKLGSNILETVTPNSNGVVSEGVCIPANTPVGTHVISLLGGGDSYTATIRVTRG